MTPILIYSALSLVVIGMPLEYFDGIPYWCIRSMCWGMGFVTCIAIATWAEHPRRLP